MRGPLPIGNFTNFVSVRDPELLKCGLEKVTKLYAFISLKNFCRSHLLQRMLTFQLLLLGTLSYFNEIGINKLQSSDLLVGSRWILHTILHNLD
jgi:hypothetical protein